MLRRTLRLPADEATAVALYRQRLAENVAKAREIDGAVLLALDRPYGETGLPLPADLHVENEDVASLCRPGRTLLLGASVHPYRKDALDALDRAAALGAVLIKWLPPTQLIDPASPLCRSFYARMRELRLPLLSHTGSERTLPASEQRLADPKRLIPALEMGLTVIAAHAGTRGGLWADPFPKDTAELCARYPRLFLDCSAFASPARFAAMRAMWVDPLLRDRFVYGSDYPVPLFPPFFWRWGDRALLRQSRKTPNPFDRYALVARAIGVPERAFTRGAELLRS